MFLLSGPKREENRDWIVTCDVKYRKQYLIILDVLNSFQLKKNIVVVTDLQQRCDDSLILDGQDIRS